MAARIEIVRINDHSDGDRSKWPIKPGWVHVDHKNYQEKLAKKWKTHIGESLREGVTYMLDRLPDGYQLLERPRTDGSKDKFLFGHPSKAYFNSPNDFLDHFLWLMQYRPDIKACSCRLCKPRPRTSYQLRQDNRIPTVHIEPASISKGRVGRPRKSAINSEDAHRPTSQDDKLSIFRTLFTRLKAETSLDEPIKETSNWDWRLIEGVVVPEAVKILNSPTFFPRLGEIVLYDASQDGSLTDHKDDTHWTPGIVAQITAEEPSVEDPFIEKPKKQLVQDHGFKIEPLRPMNRLDGSSVHNSNSSSPYFAKPFRSKYLPLLKLRPFNFFKELVEIGIDEGYSSSILDMLERSTSFVLIMKYHIRGEWPHCTIFSKGIWLGPELILVGDTVRILPTRRPSHDLEPQDVYFLDVSSIRLEIQDLDDANSCTVNVFLLGRAYSLQPSLLTAGQMQKVHLQSQTQLSQIPLARVLGRAYPTVALRKCFPDATGSDLIQLGVSGVKQARKYAQKQLRDTGENSSGWDWAETRAEQLNLKRFNEIPVGSEAPLVAKEGETEDEREAREEEKDLLRRLLRNLDRFEGRSKKPPVVMSKKMTAKSGDEMDLDEDDEDNSSGNGGPKTPQTIESDDDDEAARQVKREAAQGPIITRGMKEVIMIDDSEVEDNEEQYFDDEDEGAMEVERAFARGEI